VDTAAIVSEGVVVITKRFAGLAPWEKIYGYSRVVVAGDWGLTAGTTATVAGKVVHVGDPYGQARAAFTIALSALQAAGFERASVVRTRMYVVDMGHQSEVRRAHNDLFSDVRPVATMVEVSALADPDHLIEVEVEAYRLSGQTEPEVETYEALRDDLAHTRQLKMANEPKRDIHATRANSRWLTGGPEPKPAAEGIAARLEGMIGRLHGIVVDCENPHSLASFYEILLSMQRVQDEPDWVVIGDAPGRPGIAFARIPNYRPPTWPEGDRPQYRHFDVRVEDLALAEASVLEIGATKLPGGGESFRVYADPAGHPFCLVKLS
jgi:enamine deaminase RidA (YjgF/YER057c/UK114 family)